MIFVVIPTFNRVGHLLSCLRCLKSQTMVPRVIVCDSGSTDGTADEVARAFPEVTVLRGHSGMWWTGAVNLGLRYVIGHARPDDSFLLLNDDTLFDDEYVDRLYGCALRHRKSVVGSVCVDQASPGIICDGGVTVNWYSARMRSKNTGRRLADFPRGHTEDVSVLPGRGTLYPVSVIAEAGLPDEDRLPHYAADYEFSRRASRRGYRLLVCYDAAVRSDTTSTGLHRRQSRLSLASAASFFFDRRSTGNLVDRFRLAFMVSENPFLGAVFFLCSTARLVNRYLAQRQ